MFLSSKFIKRGMRESKKSNFDTTLHMCNVHTKKAVEKTCFSKHSKNPLNSRAAVTRLKLPRNLQTITPSES